MGEATWLRSVTSLVRSCPEDTVLVTNDGRQISTWRLLLALHSPIMAQLLSLSSERVLAISVPLSAEQINSLLADIDEGGDVFRGDQEVADLLGVRNSRWLEKIISKEVSVQVTNSVVNNSTVITKSPIKVPAGEVQNSFNLQENMEHRGDKTTINSVENTSTTLSKGNTKCHEKILRKTPLQSVLKHNLKIPHTGDKESLDRCG